MQNRMNLFKDQPTRFDVTFKFVLEQENQESTDREDTYEMDKYIGMSKATQLAKIYNDILKIAKADESKKIIKQEFELEISGKIDHEQVSQKFSDLNSFKQFLQEKELIQKSVEEEKSTLHVLAQNK